MRKLLWHPSGNRSPRPVIFVKELPVKVRVVDLCSGSSRRLVLRDVYPENLTEAA